MAGTLIADSGSTKAEWALIGAGNKQFCRTGGINPVVQSPEEIEYILRQELLPQLNNVVPDRLFIYGAGCSTVSLSNIVRVEVEKIFPAAEVYIHHDLDGAAHALFGEGKGIAAILGTGSNSCFYNGFRVMQKVPSLGFILGDEGSGAHLGRLLLRDYYYKRMPEQLEQCLQDEFDVSKDTIFRKVYREPRPNAFLADYSNFIGTYIKDYEYLQNLVKFSFGKFFDFHISQFLNEIEYPLGCVGSVGFHFSEILKEVATERGFTVEKVLQSPLNEIIAYHERKNY